jgi:hypothetical protein
MQHVFAYVENCEQDLRWSALSDLFFIAGGLGYVILSFYDVLAPGSTNAPSYVFLDVCAPVVYLLNAVIDVTWAHSIRKRQGYKKQMKEYWHDWRVMLDGVALDDALDDDICKHSEERDNCRVRQHQTALPWYVKVRRHVAHRRATLGAATFGVAAVLGLSAVLVGYLSVDATLARINTTTEDIALWLDTISAHAYVLSAVICLSGKRTRPMLRTPTAAAVLPSGGSTLAGLWSSPEVLEDFGDVLFFVGSVVDVLLCYIEFDTDHQPGYSMLSSFLWLLDALLYLRSDYVLSRSLKRNDTEGGFIC